MTPDELRGAITVIESRVVLTQHVPVTVAFAVPAVGDLTRLGITEGEARRLLGAPWWAEMAADITDTPSFCGGDETPETVLRYARDVVAEYVRKRFALTP